MQKQSVDEKKKAKGHGQTNSLTHGPTQIATKKKDHYVSEQRNVKPVIQIASTVSARIRRNTASFLAPTTWRSASGACRQQKTRPTTTNPSASSRTRRRVVGPLGAIGASTTMQMEAEFSRRNPKAKVSESSVEMMGSWRQSWRGIWNASKRSL